MTSARRCKSKARVDPAIGVGAGRGGHALLESREPAITRMAPDAPLEAIGIVLRGASVGRCNNGNGEGRE